MRKLIFLLIGKSEILDVKALARIPISFNTQARPVFQHFFA